MKKVSVIILNWNGKSLMERYLPTVVAGTPTQLTPDVEAEVAVADNGSTDGSQDWLREHWPGVRLVCFDRNYGFAEGYNKAVEAVACDYAVLLNSDVRVEDGWLLPLVDYMEVHEEVAACQPKILSDREPGMFEYAGAAGGFIDRLGYPFCRGRIQSLVEEDRGQYDNVTDIFWATGACLMVRRDDYLRAGGLDGGFFAHMEEIDLCWRLRSMCRRLVCIPQSRVFHLGGGTLDASNPRKTFLNFRNNLLMLYKNLPEKKLRCVMFQRSLLDVMAAFFFLLKGETGSFKAVFRARREFRRLKKQWAPVREQVQRQALKADIPEIYPGISIFSFYFKGWKTFDRLSRFQSAAKPESSR